MVCAGKAPSAANSVLMRVCDLSNQSARALSTIERAGYKNKIVQSAAFFCCTGLPSELMTAG